MRRVIIESPYAGDVEANRAYALRALRDCLDRKESALASHLLYTQVLDDTSLDQRDRGLDAGLAWYKAKPDACVVYCDLGISPGMAIGIHEAIGNMVPVLFRWLDRELDVVEGRIVDNSIPF